MRSWTRSVTCGWSGKSSSSVRSTVQSNARRPRGHASCIVVARDMSIDDLWYKNAIIYCLDVEKYQDANGDGIGDFEGLDAPARLPAGPRRDLRVAAAVLPVAEPRQRLRRRRLLRRPRQARVARRLRRLHEPRRGARHARASSIWSSTTRRSTRRGSSRRAPTRSPSSATGMSGPTIRPKNHKEGIVFPGQQTTTWT